MSFNFGAATTTSGSTFGTATPSTGFSFGSGDPSKPLFGGTNAVPAPATTAANTSFGASKPLSFGAFASPPNQTVGSPGFGQATANQNVQNQLFSATTQQQSIPPGFGTTATQGQVSAFGTSPSTGFAFNKPAATTSGFGISTPASGFSAPAVSSATTTSAPQTAQSIGFGQSSLSLKPGGAFSFAGEAPGVSFGAPAATSAAPAPSASFSLTPQQPAQPTSQTGLGFGTAQNTGLNFGAPQSSAPATGFQAPTALSFSSPASSAPTAPTNISFGTSQPATGLSFGTTPNLTTQPPMHNFGQPTSQPAASQPTGLSFGASTAATQPTAGISLGVTSTAQPAGLGFGTTKTPSTGISFGTPAAQSTGFGTTPAQAATSQPTPLSFGTSTAAASLPSTGLSYGTSTAQPVGLSFGKTTPTPSTGLTLGAATTAAQSTGLSFGTTSATSTASTGFGFSATSAATGLSFGTKPTALATSSAASTTAPSGVTALSKTTTSSAMSTLSTATTTTAAVAPQAISSITFAELEENINKWTLELEEQEMTFINQATQINAWDRLLIANGEKIVELNDAVQSVKNEQQSLEHELDFVLAQQKELEDLLAPMEKQLIEDSGDRVRDPEREHMYTLAENLDTQLRQMSEDLKEVIEHLNETNRSQDSNDPIVQIGRILNAHMSSMQWIDSSIAQISNKLDQLKATHDTLRRDNERSFQLTYN